jgi:hypothetical protein
VAVGHVKRQGDTRRDMIDIIHMLYLLKIRL